jgi:hypothetical protein
VISLHIARLLRRMALPLLILVALTACGDTSLPFVPHSPTPEPPHEVTVTTIDRDSGMPIPEAELKAGSTAVTTSPEGSATVTALTGTKLTAAAVGYDAATADVPADGALQLKLRSNVVSGTVTDQGGDPVSGVRVFVDGDPESPIVRTDAQGAYVLPGVPDGATLIYKRAGFRLAQLAATDVGDVVALQPFAARALYAPAAVFEAPGRLDKMLDLIDRTEVNAMVIDVKETAGNLYWDTDLPMATQIGAVMEHPLFELNELLPKLKERGIYTIARMVVMKDNTLGKAKPDFAVKNARTGGPWRDFGGGIWLDPFEPGVAEYIASLAGDLADKGFDEVQLDYVRFFSDGPYDEADTNLPNTQSFRLPAVGRLFRLVSNRLAHTHAFLGADVFPVAFIAADDQGIGQRPEVIMPYVDYFDPMVYPSHYGTGVFGYPVPNEHPYEIIDDTLELMNAEAKGLPMVIRPWIQDFGYGSFRGYTRADVLAEMKALRDNGAMGWMIWNAQARFTESALGPPVKGEASAPMTAVPSASAASPPSASPSPLASASAASSASP